MIVPASKLPEVFNALKQDKHTSQDKGVLVFVQNGDVDSLCACMQLEVGKHACIDRTVPGTASRP